MNRRPLVLLLAICAVGVSRPASAGVLFGVTGGSPNDRIVVGNEGDTTTLVDVSQRPGYTSATTIWSVTADYDDGDVYWSQTDMAGASGETVIHRRDAATGAFTSRVVGAFSPQVYGLAYHQTDNQLYFGQGAAIFRLNEDLGVAGQVFAGGEEIIGLALDEAGGNLFFTDVDAGVINRLSLSGGSTPTQLATSAQPRGIAYDPIGDDIYWMDRNLDQIFRISADGSDNGVAELFHDVSFSSTNHSLTIDGGRLYWAEASSANRGVWSLNLDGTGLTRAYPTEAGVFGLASISAVPEPSSFVALALGGLGLGYRRLRRTKAAPSAAGR